MIIGKIHPGSGLGDQLFTYITTRTIALDKGYDFGFVGKEFFKGKDFMQLDWGKDSPIEHRIEYPQGKLELADKIFVYDKLELWEAPNYYDPEVNFIEDGTVIDATCAQDERYWGKHLDKIREWLKVEPLAIDENVCIINFRGGEFALFPELFLTEDYWRQAIDLMKKRYPKITFSVHTDDVGLAERFFSSILAPKGFMVTHDLGLNWRSVNYAKHLILANSAFGIIPALLNEFALEVVAPRYHARRNIKQWSMPQNYYKKFTYL